MSKVSGVSLLSAFDHEVTRRDAARRLIENEIAAEERRISEANTRRESAFTELAELYAADEGKLAASFGEISQRLQAIFNEKMQRRRELNTLLDRAAGLMENIQAQITSAQEKTHSCQRRLDEAMRAVERDLNGDAAYLDTKREAEETRTKVQQLQAAHARISSESESKLSAFNGNRLFRYLVAAKFGTPDYRARGLIAAGDEWLAGLVGWQRNFPSFTLLVELPAFAQKRVVDAQRRAELAATKLTFHIHEREAAHGVDQARAEVAATAQALRQVQAQITKLEEQRAGLVAELQALDSRDDPYQKRAKAEMKKFLTTHPIAELKAKAAATPTSRDNEQVEQIERAEAEINEGRKRVKEMTASRAEAEAQHQRAVTARRRFSSNYTGTYDQFDRGVDITTLLTGYILGRTTEGSLWSGVDQHHRDTTPSYSYSSPSSSDSGSAFSFGGDSSSGFSSGGGDSGGGFSTGGGD